MLNEWSSKELMFLKFGVKSANILAFLLEFKRKSLIFEHGFGNPIRPKTWSNPERPLLFLCRCLYRINEMMFLRLYRIRATVIVLEFSSTQ